MVGRLPVGPHPLSHERGERGRHVVRGPFPRERAERRRNVRSAFSRERAERGRNVGRPLARERAEGRRQVGRALPRERAEWAGNVGAFRELNKNNPLSNRGRHLIKIRHGRVSTIFYYPGIEHTRVFGSNTQSSSLRLINRAWRDFGGVSEGMTIHRPLPFIKYK